MVPRSLRVVLATLFFLAPIAFVAPAHASQVGFDGHTVSYTAAPGEVNSVSLTVTSFDASCGAVPAPCLLLSDSYARISATTGGCELTYSGLGGDAAACPIPHDVRADLGDREDSWWDWDGPSTIDAGAGNDTPLIGQGANDVIHGGSGNDALYGDAGDDILDGGTGDDDLDGIPGGEPPGLDTSGADTYIGGGGSDSVDYSLRSEDLHLTPDGIADDGAPGEHDNIGADIATIFGGTGNDTIIGNAGPNLLVGAGGDDVLTGSAGDDTLLGRNGVDHLDGGAGQDWLEGDDGDDVLNGGPDVDQFFGDWPVGSATGADQIDARDGNAELVHCGPGSDAARLDATDVVTGMIWSNTDVCESVDRSAAASGTASGTGSRTASKLSIVAVACDRAGRLVVRLSLPTRGAASVTATAKLGHRTARVARTRAKVRSAGRLRVTLKPTAAARRAVKRRALAVTVKVAFTPHGGAAQTVRRTVKVRARR